MLVGHLEAEETPMRKLWDPRGKLQRPVNMPNEPGKPTHTAPTADKRQKWPPASIPLEFS